MKIITKVTKHMYNILVLLCVLTLTISCSAEEQEDLLKSDNENNDISDIIPSSLGISVLEDENYLKIRWDKIEELSSFKSYKISYYKPGMEEKSILIDSEDVLDTKIPLDNDDQGVDYTVNFLGVDKDDKSTQSVSLNVTIPLRVPPISNIRVNKNENTRTISWDFTPNTATGFTRYSVLYYNEDTPSEVKLKDFFDVNDKQVVLEDIIEGKTYYVSIYVVGKKGTLPSIPKLYKLL